jgi:hypothetical protein
MINCFHLFLSVIFQNGSLYVGWSFMGPLGSTARAEGRAGKCLQPLLGGSSLPVLLLLPLSREFFHTIQENRDSKYD